MKEKFEGNDGTRKLSKVGASVKKKSTKERMESFKNMPAGTANFKLYENIDRVEEKDVDNER